MALDGGGKISYKEHGEGKAVVLLHGFCGSSAYWDQLIPLLPDNFRWILPDLRGHGQSGAPSGEYSMEAFANDLAMLLKRLETGPAIVLGHSLGGYVTLALAELYPELLAGFGLIHSTGLPDTEAGKEGRLKGIKVIEEQGLSVFLDGFVPKLFAPEYTKSRPEQVDKMRQIGLETNPDAVVRTLQGMRTRPDRNDVLAQAKVPVLLVAGAHDQIIPAERTFSISGGQIMQRKIEESGHSSMMETPDQLADAIRTFIATV
jgi:3-oxoadipate enol-lactonase